MRSSAYGKYNNFPIRRILKYIGLLFIAGLLFVGLAFLYYSRTVPDPGVISSRKVNESTKIYDKTGQSILYDIHGEEKRTIIAWEQVPQNIKDATLSSEDAEFYNHSGYDLKGILRAVYKDVSTLNASQGGSTITQQLIKLSLLGEEKTFSRKIKEVILSVRLEKEFTKDQIFWMYLNQIPYGSNAYGIEAASQTFFDKHARDLNLAEAALLASLPKAPSYYSPYGNHLDDLINRRNSNLKRMKTLGFINQTELDQALAEKPQFKKVQDAIIAPHFVIMVKEYLEKKYGEDMVENGGLQVTTTLDIELQQEAEDVVTKYGETNAKKYRANNAALTALDPSTGQILAMVGSRDYFDIANEGNFNVATALRQPGSSFKPIAYAEALKKGYTDSTILFDVKTEFNPACNSSGTQVVDHLNQKCYNPDNYDGRFRGPVTMRQALAGSLNVPSVEVLYLAGIEDTIDLANSLGITSLQDRSRYGLSLVLGGGEVKLIDMVSVFGVFANDGIKNDTSFILKVASGDGRVLEENKNNQSRILDAQVTRTLSDMLSDNNARTAVFGANSPLAFNGKQIAAKTGTTQQNRDAWVLGYTPSVVVGVWVGNNNNTPMTAAGAGISAAGPLWHEFMDFATRNTAGERFISPDPEVVDKIMLNGQYDSSQPHNILYYVDRSNPRGDYPSDPYSDPQFKNWEESTQRWFGIVPFSPSPSPIPSNYMIN